MPQPSPRNLNLWKRGLGRVPESVWDQTELETLVLADKRIDRGFRADWRIEAASDAGPGAQSVDSVPEAIGNWKA